MEVWGRVYLFLVPSLLILDKFLLGLQGNAESLDLCMTWLLFT